MTFQELIDFWNEHAADHYCRNLEIHQASDKGWLDKLKDEYDDDTVDEAINNGIEHKLYDIEDTHFYFNDDEGLFISFSTAKQLLEKIGIEFFIETLIS